MVTVSWQTLLTAAAVLGALATILKSYNRGYDFVRRQKEQDEVIKSIQEEPMACWPALKACKSRGQTAP